MDDLDLMSQVVSNEWSGDPVVTVERRPHRWRVLVFDDENFTRLLGHPKLRAMGFASNTAQKHVRDEAVAWLTCEDGYSFDLLGVRYVREGRKALRGELPGLEHLKDIPFAFAFVDWKDASPVTMNADGEPHGQLMGFLLALEARKRDPECTVVIMSSYPVEVENLFESSWVRAILGNSEGGTLDVSSALPDRDKLNAFAEPFIVEEERRRATAYVLADRKLLEAIVARLDRLPEMLRGVPAATVREEAARHQWGPDDILRYGGVPLSEAVETAVCKVIEEPVVGERLPWLFPFSFAPIYREIIDAKGALLRWQDNEPLDLTSLASFSTAILPTLLAAKDVHGIAIVKQVAPHSVEYRGGGVVCYGLHPSRGKGCEQQFRVLARGFTEKVQAIQASYNPLVKEEDLIFVTLRNIAAKITEMACNPPAGSWEKACDEVERLNHEELRFAPIGLVAKTSKLEIYHRKAAGWSPRHSFSFRHEPTGDDVVFEAGKKVWLYGVRSDVEEALVKLWQTKSPPAEIEGKTVWLAGAKTLYGSVCIKWRDGMKRADLEALMGTDGGNLSTALLGLKRYYAVAIGNEHALLTFPIREVPSWVSDGEQMHIELHFVVSRVNSDGGIGSLMPPP